MKKWDTATLEEVCSKIKNGLAVKQSEDAGGTPITRIETIAKWNINPNKCGYAGLDAQEHNSRLLQHGDILFSHINSLDHLGKTAIYEGTPKQLIHGMNLLGIRANQDRITPSYLLFCLRSNQVNAQVLKAANKSVNQASISTTNLKKIQIPLPPLLEQKRIAGILDAADALRAKRRAALAQLDTLLQSTFLDLFGDPVTNPKGWEIRKLSQTVSIQGGFAFKSKDYCESGTRLVKISNVHSENLKWDEVDYVPDSYLTQHKDFSLQTGDLVMALTRPIIKSLNSVKIATVGPLDAPSLLNQRVARFIFLPNSVIGKSYLLAFCRTQFFKNKVQKFCSESLQPNMSTKQLGSLTVPLPPLALQQRFAAIVEQVETQKTRMRAQLTELDTLFAALQQRAFNGEL